MNVSFKEFKDFLYESSGSGDEAAYSVHLQKIMEDMNVFDKIYTDPLNNVIAEVNSGCKCHIMLEAHYDEISAAVSHICENGFIQIRPVGGVDLRCLPSSEITVNGLNGIVCSVPPHLMSPEDRTTVRDFNDLYIDLGLDYSNVRNKISVGDRVIFNKNIIKLMNGRISAGAIDNKAGVYAVFKALEKLSLLKENNKMNISVSALFSTQEEVGLRGARTGSYTINPDEAVSIDVTFAKQPGTAGPELGSGAVVEFSPVIDKKISKKLYDTAVAKKIKHTINVESGFGGTDGDVIPRTKNGVPTAVISIPIRNMHTPVEVADMKDIKSAAELLYEYVCLRNKEFIS